jgi:hypothetical protein
MLLRARFAAGVVGKASELSKQGQIHRGGGATPRNRSIKDLRSPPVAVLATSASPQIYSPYDNTKKHRHHSMIGPDEPSNSTPPNLIFIGPAANSRVRTKVKESAAQKAAPVMGMKLGCMGELNHILTP